MIFCLNCDLCDFDDRHDRRDYISLLSGIRDCKSRIAGLDTKSGAKKTVIYEIGVMGRMKREVMLGNVMECGKGTKAKG